MGKVSMHGSYDPEEDMDCFEEEGGDPSKRSTRSRGVPDFRLEAVETEGGDVLNARAVMPGSVFVCQPMFNTITKTWIPAVFLAVSTSAVAEKLTEVECKKLAARTTVRLARYR